MEEDTEDKGLNTGKPIYEIPKSLYAKAAKDFAEGNSKLEELLYYCFQKEIKTIACCAGHYDKKKDPYLDFQFNDYNLKYILKIMKKISEREKFEIRFMSTSESLPKSFSVHASSVDDANELFDVILEACKEEKEVDTDSLTPLDLAMFNVMNIKSYQNLELELSENYENKTSTMIIDDVIVYSSEHKSQLLNLPQEVSEKQSNAILEVFNCMKENDYIEKEDSSSTYIKPNVLLYRKIDENAKIRLVEAQNLVNIADYAEELLKVKAMIEDSMDAQVVGCFNSIPLNIENCKTPQDVITLYIKACKDKNQLTNELQQSENEISYNDVIEDISKKDNINQPKQIDDAEVNDDIIRVKRPTIELPRVPLICEAGYGVDISTYAGKLFEAKEINPDTMGVFNSIVLDIEEIKNSKSPEDIIALYEKKCKEQNKDFVGIEIQPEASRLSYIELAKNANSEGKELFSLQTGLKEIKIPENYNSDNADRFWNQFSQLPQGLQNENEEMRLSLYQKLKGYRVFQAQTNTRDDIDSFATSLFSIKEQLVVSGNEAPILGYFNSIPLDITNCMSANDIIELYNNSKVEDRNENKLKNKLLDKFKNGKKIDFNILSDKFVGDDSEPIFIEANRLVSIDKYAEELLKIKNELSRSPIGISVFGSFNSIPINFQDCNSVEDIVDAYKEGCKAENKSLKEYEMETWSERLSSKALAEKVETEARPNTNFNPNIAFNRMIEGNPSPRFIEAQYGVDIRKYAEELLKAKKQSKESPSGVTIFGSFNSIPLDIRECDSIEDIVNFYKEECETNNIPVENVETQFWEERLSHQELTDKLRISIKSKKAEVKAPVPAKGMAQLAREVLESQQNTIEGVNSSDRIEQLYKAQENDTKEGEQIE